MKLMKFSNDSDLRMIVFAFLGVWIVCATQLQAVAVNVQLSPPPPTVKTLTPDSVICENSDPLSNFITVCLTEAFINTVVVDLTMDVPNIIALSTSQLVFNIGETSKIVYITPLDGTRASYNPGVQVIPNVIGTPAAVAYFTVKEPGYVRVQNVYPLIVNPVQPGDNTEPLYAVPCGRPWSFYWDVADVPADLASMRVTWHWGDGAVDVLTGASGSFQHTYSRVGETIIHVVAFDKDGGVHQVMFAIEVVEPPAEVIALEISGKDSVYAGETTFYRCTAFYNDESYVDVTALVDWEVSGPDHLSFENGVLNVGSLESNFTCTVSAEYLGFTDSMVVALIELPRQALPYSENFESELGAWRGAPGSEFNWLLNSGATPSHGTGPSMASDGDYYIYAEASEPNCPAKVAAIEGAFDFGAALLPVLSFDYHMYGATMGALYVDVYDGVWHEAICSRIGQQHQGSGAVWNLATVDLGEYAGISNLLIRVRAVTGSHYLSDIAIDNMALIDNIATLEPSFQKWTVVEKIPSDSRRQDDTPAMDGIPNLLKYACGLPAMDACTTADLMSIQPADSNTFSMLYYKSRTAEDVTLQPIWAESLYGPWSTVDITTEKLSENAEREQWRASIPLGESGFIRLRTTAE